MIFRPTYIFLLCAVLFVAVPAAAIEIEAEALDFPAQEDYVTSPARSPRPVSQIAENVSVITAEDIALLNAHTVADVLQAVPGIQFAHNLTPGNMGFFSVNSILNTYLMILMDGVPQTTIIEGVADLGLIPAQQVERIEIIKGPASAAWGPALGGVINIVTKSPDPERQLGVTGLVTIGEKNTDDLRGELTGTAGRFGYYLSGGNLHSRGLVPGARVNNNNIYGKFTYDLPTRGLFTLGIDYRDLSREFSYIPAIDAYDTTEQQIFNYYLSLTQPLGDRLTLELNGRATDQDIDGRLGFISDRTALWKHYLTEQTSRAVTGRLTWYDGGKSLVAGLEYIHDRFVQSEPVQLNDYEQQNVTLDRFGAYLNGSLPIGRFTLLPGIRFDRTDLKPDVGISYTLGGTYRLSDKTILRGYTARGYSLPNLAHQNGLQKIWSVHAGVESEAIPYLWLKGTLFYNNMWDVEKVSAATGATTIRKEVYQGYELEAKTVPVHGFSLGLGYTFTDARDPDTDQKLEEKPRHSLKVSGRYRNEDLGLSGIVTGNYVWWNMPAENNARYKAMIWDLSLTQKLLPSREASPELFFSVHNIFDGSQYRIDWYKNYGRWLEGGVRFRF